MDRLKRQLCETMKAQLNGSKAPLPEAGAALIEAFHALSRARSYNHHGPNPIN